MLGLLTVKISAKSETFVEQPSAVIGRGLRAMTPNYILTLKFSTFVESDVITHDQIDQIEQ